MPGGPLYEKTARVEPDLVGEFADWLDAHVVDAATFAGVESVDHSGPGGDDGTGFTWRYVFTDDESLDVFLEREANDTYPGARQTFGERIELDNRVLREDDAYRDDSAAPKQCLNCGAVLRGQYCGNCGQRATNRLISLWELVRDAFGDLFELDSRLWRTVIPLLVRPGLLTHDYLSGRRARYMPPFRMYLVLSLVFFVVAFFKPKEELALFFVPEEPAAESSAAAPPDAESSETADAAAADRGPETESDELTAIPEEARETLEQFGLDIDDINERIEADAREAAEAEAGGRVSVEDGGINVELTDDDGEELDGNCELEDYDVSDLPAWLQVRLSKERAIAVCERVTEDGDGFFKNVIDNIPVALFILLPLMALVLVFLYPLSRRYYVEHLLFFVHFHAFFFLMLTLQVLWARLVGAANGPDWLGVLPIVATSFYIPVYLFKAMRRVYEQGWFVTFFKFILLKIAYSIGFTLMLGFAFLIAVAGA